ncbi:MAG: coiled-coil domain-containing protein [Ramlibacter sp.]
MALDLETIGLGFDASGLEKGTRAFEANERAANKTADAADKVGRKASEAGDKFSKAGKDADGAADATRRLEGASDLLARTMKTLAGIYATMRMADYVRDAALLNARYETLGVSMTMVGRNAGYTAQQMEAAALAMQKQGISMVESRQQAMRLVQSQIDLAHATKLARIAQDAAVIGNMNSSEAFASMIHGIKTGQTDVLRTIGLNVSMEQSYREIAQQLGKNQSALTQQEKTQGVLNAVMREGAAIAGTYEAAMDTAGKQLNSMRRYTEDLKVKLGEVFNETLTVGVMAFTEKIKDANGELDELAANGQLKAWGGELVSVFVSVANAIDNIMSMARMAGTWAAARSERGDIVNKWQKVTPLFGSLTPEQKAQRDAELREAANREQEAQTSIASNFDRFQRAYDERQAAVQAKAAKAAAQTAATEKFRTDTMAYWQKQRQEGLLKEADYVRAMQQFLITNYGDNHKYNSPTVVDDKGANAAIDARIAKLKFAQEAEQRIARETVDRVLSERKRGMLGEEEAINAAAAAELRALGSAVTAAERELALGRSKKDNIKEVAALENAVATAREAVLTRQHKLERDIAEVRYTRGMANEKALAEFREQYASDWAKSQADDEKATQQARLAMDEYEKSLRQAAAALGAEQGAIGSTDAERAVAIGNLKIEVALRQRIREIEANRSLSPTDRNELLDRANAGAEEERRILAMNAKLEEHKGIWSSIDSTARSVFTNVEDSGVSAFKRIGQTLKASVLDMMYQLTVRKWLLSVSVAASGGAAGAAGSAAQQAGGSGIGSLAGSALSGLSTFGSFASTGFMNTLAGGAGLIGNIGTGLSAGMSLMGGGSIMSGLGMMAGALGPIALGVGAIMSFVKGRGETRVGGQYDGTALVASPSGGEINGDTTRQTIATTIESVNKTLGLMGSSATISAFQSGLEQSEKGKGFAYARGVLSTGQQFGDWSRPTHMQNRGSMSAEQVAAKFGEELKQATIGALQAANVPGLLGDWLRSLGDVNALSGGALDKAMERINKALTEKQNLEEQLYALTHTELEVLNRTRSKEREALDETNRALYDQIAALADQRAITEQRTELERRLLEVQGDTAALRARELAKIDPANRSIQERIWLLEDERRVGDERNALERRLLELSGDTAAVRGRELAALDPANRALQQRVWALEDEARIGQERKGLESQLLQLLGNSTELRRRERETIDATNLALFDRITLVQDVRTGTDAAYAALERAIAAEQKRNQIALDAAQEQLDAIKGIFDLLKSEVRSLYQEVLPEQGAAAGRAFIDSAFDAAQRTGHLPDQEELANAIGAARSQSPDSFGSAFEFNRDRLVLAGKLAQFQGIVGTQKSAAERTVDAIKAQMKHLEGLRDDAQMQISALRGIDVSVQSVAAAIERLALALARESAATGRPVTSKTEQWVDTQYGRVWQSTGGAVGVANASGFSINTKDGLSYTGEEVVGWVNNQLAANDPRAVYDAALAKGVSGNSLDKLMGWADGTSNAWARNAGLPQFASGADDLPRDMLAVVHKGEEIVPAHTNRANKGASVEVAAQLDQLRGEQRAQARAQVQLNARMVKLLERWESNGMPETRNTTV